MPEVTFSSAHARHMKAVKSVGEESARENSKEIEIQTKIVKKRINKEKNF
jgi:hypothetical protein